MSLAYETAAQAQAKRDELERRFKAINPSYTFNSEAEMTTFWNDAVEKPIEKSDLFRKDLNEIWTWNSALTPKAEKSREYDVMLSETVATYADMIAKGTPFTDKIFHVLNDEDKATENTVYLWFSDSNKRRWLATVEDN